MQHVTACAWLLFAITASEGAFQGWQQAALHSHPGQISNHLWSQWHLQVPHRVWLSYDNLLHAAAILHYCVPLSSYSVLAVTVYLLTGSINPVVSSEIVTLCAGVSNPGSSSNDPSICCRQETKECSWTSDGSASCSKAKARVSNCPTTISSGTGSTTLWYRVTFRSLTRSDYGTTCLAISKSLVL